jgi:anti-anti-sigma regulatory factor
MKGMILDMTNLKSVDDTGWNYLLFTKQQRGADFSLQLKGLNPEITQGLKDAELDEEFGVIS